MTKNVANSNRKILCDFSRGSVSFFVLLSVWLRSPNLYLWQQAPSVCLSCQNVVRRAMICPSARSTACYHSKSSTDTVCPAGYMHACQLSSSRFLGKPAKQVVSPQRDFPHQQPRGVPNDQTQKSYLVSCSQLEASP